MSGRSVRLSPGVWLYPAGRPPPEGVAGLTLPQQPGRAFGDGSHPTTRLCAGAVDFLCRRHPLDGVLDVGTGTGVLARIARARGARFVVATDVDPLALAEARANVKLEAGEEILVVDAPPDSWGSRFQLVVANILEGPLVELAPALKRALVPEGLLLLSGFVSARHR